MRVLVTGGAGYIGSKLVPKLLDKGYEVRVLDLQLEGSLSDFLGHHSFEFIQGDIRCRDVVYRSLERIDAVTHLAAIVPGSRATFSTELIHEVNYNATKLLVDLCRERGVQRLVFISSCGNYGMRDASKPANEYDPLDPTSPYSESKVRAEEYVLSSSDDNLCVTVLRLATVFGPSPKMSFNSMINSFVRDALLGKNLTVYSPSSWRPFVHIDDVVEALIMVLQAPRNLVSGQVFNVGSNSMNHQKIYVVEMIRQFFRQAKIQIREDLADPRNYKVSFDKISTVLGFQTTKNLADGIKEMKQMLENVMESTGSKGNIST